MRMQGTELAKRTIEGAVGEDTTRCGKGKENKRPETGREEAGEALAAAEAGLAGLATFALLRRMCLPVPPAGREGVEVFTGDSAAA